MSDTSFERTELQSGIRIVTERVPGVRSASVGLWVDTGSRDESEGQLGLTHFLEHLLFKGTEAKNARDIAEAFDTMGADVNAVTGKEQTYFYSRMMDAYLPEAVDLLLDMMRNSVLDAAEIDSERNVVLEEINMHNDSPDELVHDYLIEALWDGHRLGHMVLGDADVIRNVDRSSLVAFHGGSYVATRLVAAAAGAVDHSAFVDMIERGTAGMLTGSEPDRLAAMEAAGTKLIRRKDTEQAHITIGTDGLEKNHPDRFALAVIDNILGGSMSSRLFQKIREERGLVYSIYSYSSLFMGMGMVGIYAGTHPSQAALVLDLVEGELRAVQEKGFRSEELERARNHIRGSLYISNEDSASRMSRIAKSEISGGEQLSIDEIDERVRAVSLEDLSRVFSETWASGKLSLAVIGPFDEEDLDFPATLEA